VNFAGNRSWILSQTATAACAIGTWFEYFRWKHSTMANAPVKVKIFLGMSILFSLAFLVRLFYRGVVTRRDYFGQEMEHRRSVAKGSH
jgi:hypothetical protein